jgi:ABC-type cobalt transport system, ATPase component
MQDFIKTENLCYSYDNGEGELNQVLSDINLTVKQGEFLCILGHNGCGKSTLAKHFNAMLIPAKGKCYVNEMDTQNEEIRYNIRQTVGMVLQNPDNQIVATIVEEDVAFAPENLGIPSDEIRKRVDEALEMVEMSDYAKHAPHKLSGGQKQRVAIAGIIAMRPECIVLDEPTAMLDPKGRKEVMKTIKNLNKNHNITIILITHHMEEAIKSDRVIIMESGKIIMEGTPGEVFSRVEELKKASLDVPQPTGLIYELIKEGIELPKDILTTEQCADVIYKFIGDKTKCQ